MCGGTIEFSEGASVGVCDYCGTKQTLPRLDNDKKANLYDRANHFRRNNDFDKAMNIYEQILSEDSTDAEAYWSLVLCRYGIEYVEDPESHKRIPTVNRAQFTSVFDDDNYKSALQYADVYQRSIYEEEAKTINDIQKGILAISQKEEPFDVFICYKETDANGRRTQDSVLANDLYHQLTQEGFKVFFSRITLEDKLGMAYEPYIFAALNSAKVMVVLGTKPEHFNAVWVKNEWSRYLALVKNSGGKKILIPAYKDMDPYDLPEEFSHLQAQDMSKLGFMQDLIRGIKKIAQADAPKTTVVKETVISGGNANTAPLLKRAFMFLEDSDWKSADEYCEKVLDQDPECAEAYLGKLMAELKVSKKANLKNCAVPFDDKNNYKKAIRFGDNELVSLLNSYTEYIKERNENDRLCGIYNAAKSAMENAAGGEEALVNAAEKFSSISGFKDSKELAVRCRELANTKHNDGIYNSAKAKMNSNKSSDVEAAAHLFEKIPGWRDSDELAKQCREKLNESIYAEAKSQMESGYFETAIYMFEDVSGWRDSDELAKQCREKLNESIYAEAKSQMESGCFETAIYTFEAVSGWRDSDELAEQCREKLKESIYAEAKSQMESGELGGVVRAIGLFRKISGWRDADEQVEKLIEAKQKRIKELKDKELKDAEKNLAAWQHRKEKLRKKTAAKQTAKKVIVAVVIVALIALIAFIIVNKTVIAPQNAYNKAIEFLNNGNLVDAYETLTSLKGYKDSAQKAEDIFEQYKTEKLKVAKVGDTIYFGIYEQDNDESNGKENIKWIVLAKDDNKILVISDKALNCVQYGDNSMAIIASYIKSPIRLWMNDTFFNEAFSSEEKGKIQNTYIPRDSDSGMEEAITDNIFLLSKEEMDGYFSNDKARRCVPTAYAKANGAYIRNKYCWWWSRSTLYVYRNYVYAVSEDGSIGSYVAYESPGICIRPAMWIDLNS